MSLNKFIKAFTFLIATLCVQIAYAETSTKGMAEITYDSWRTPDENEINKAKKIAINSAISRWASKQGSSFLKNYESIRQEVENKSQDYVLGTSIIDEEINKDKKTYRIILKVSLDDTRIKNLVSASSDVAQTSDDELSYMTFIFVSRRQGTVQKFDDKVYKRADAENSSDGEEYEDASENGIEFSSTSNKTSKLTTGGSTTQRSDKIEYQVSSSNEISIAMTEVFSSNGFEVVEAEYLEEETGGLLSIDAFKDDFSVGDDISGKTRRNAAKGAKMLDIPYIAIGTLDIGMKDKDPSSGLTRVFVTVTGKLVSVKKRFPKTIVSVGPVQFSGLGPNQSVAERNALKLASENAATELINQMNAKGVK